MSRKNSGHLVTTKTGQKGRTRHADQLVNNKIIVYLLDNDWKPIFDEHGEQKKLLCDPQTLTVNGMYD